MIKLTPIAPPKKLTPQLVKQLTDEFKKTGNSVWNKDFIKEPLLEMSCNKCCYCECNIKEESKYLEVEHFRPKSFFPDLVLEWSNLLPACSRCNRIKRNFNPDINPIINPVYVDPKPHLKLVSYQFRPRDKSALGKETIDALKLNERARLMIKRYEIGSALQEEFVKLLKKADKLIILPAGNEKEKSISEVIITLTNLLEEALPRSEYSVTAATTIATSEDFTEIKQILQIQGVWTTELEILEQAALKISLE